MFCLFGILSFFLRFGGPYPHLDNVLPCPNNGGSCANKSVFLATQKLKHITFKMPKENMIIPPLNGHVFWGSRFIESGFWREVALILHHL